MQRRPDYYANSLQLKPGRSMANYFTAHRLIRRNMHQAGYFKIGDVLTTVTVILNGLARHPKYLDAVRAIPLAGMPHSIAIIEDRLMGEKAIEAETQRKITRCLQRDKEGSEEALKREAVKRD